MKLLVLSVIVIDGEGAEVPTKLIDIADGWTEEMLEGNDAFKIIQNNGTIPTGYSDISSIENWKKYGLRLVGKVQLFMDWKCLRTEIKTLVEAKTNNNIGTNFGLLTTEEQKIACEFLTNIVPTSNFISTYPSSVDRQKIGYAFDENSINARKQRYSAMRGYFLGKLGGENGLLFYDVVIREGREQAYFGGIENKADDGSAGLKDIIMGTDIYDGAGENKQGLLLLGYPITDGSGDTLEIVCNTLIGIMGGMY